MTPADPRYAALALRLGTRGLGRVWPWPSVGCVIVKNGRIVGRGGSDADRVAHAEVVALAQAGAAARGATVYVSLEPCAHHGRTPPCADALIAAGVARVVSALEDPNPLVAGQGHARLRAAGIDVDVGLMAQDAIVQHRGFLTRLAQGRPMVTLKLAASFDGRIATATGESRWITGPDARRWVHGLRARHDAVLVGGGTARDDNPALNVRGLGDVRQPVRVVLSRRLDVPEDGALAHGAGAGPLWICHGADAEAARIARWQARGARTFEVVVGQGGQLDPAAALAALGEAGLTRVLCEGGGALAASLLQAGLVDDLIGFTAGVVLGAEGQPEVGALGLDQLADAPRFDLVESRAIGNDVMHLWRCRSMV